VRGIHTVEDWTECAQTHTDRQTVADILTSSRSQADRSNQRQADFGLVSGADKDAVVFRERHQVLRQSQNDQPGCVADLAHVLVLLYVHDQTQTCSKAIVDGRRRLWCCILTNSTKHCSCLTFNWQCNLANSSIHNVVLEFAHCLHGMKARRHP